MDKIPPIDPNANNFGNFDGRNSQNNQNSKDSSHKFEKFKDFFVTMLESFNKLQSKGHNNDSKNTITNSDTTAQILTPTNSYGSGNGGNNRLDIQTQRQSTTTEKDGRDNSTAHNGGFTQLLGEKDERAKDKSRESRAMGEGSQGLGEGSENITQLRNAKAYTTATERGRLYELTKENSKLKYLLNSFAIKDSLKGIENAKNTIQLTNHAKTLDKTLTKLKQTFPNEVKNDELIKIAEEKLKPIKEKYLLQKTKENIHKSKSKTKDDDGLTL